MLLTWRQFMLLIDLSADSSHRSVVFLMISWLGESSARGGEAGKGAVVSPWQHVVTGSCLGGLVVPRSYDVPMTRFVQQPDYEGAEFIDLSMASATFREVDLSGARMHGVLLSNADIDGAIDGMRVNGVEVMPLIEAELDRLHP